MQRILPGRTCRFVRRAATIRCRRGWFAFPFILQTHSCGRAWLIIVRRRPGIAWAWNTRAVYRGVAVRLQPCANFTCSLELAIGLPCLILKASCVARATGALCGLRSLFKIAKFAGFACRAQRHARQRLELPRGAYCTCNNFWR